MSSSSLQAVHYICLPHMQYSLVRMIETKMGTIFKILRTKIGKEKKVGTTMEIDQ